MNVGREGGIRSWSAKAGPPVLVAIVALGIWLLVTYRVLDERRRFLLPPPQDVIAQGLLDDANRGEILAGLWGTTQVALTGLAVATVVGLLLAVAMSQARWIEHSLYPYAVLVQTIPTLALVPLFGFWWGFNFTSRAAVCVTIALFPIVTNTLFGLQSVDSRTRDLFVLHGTGRLTQLWKMSLPHALPAFFTGLRISAGLSVVGAIVADFFFRQGPPGIGRLLDVYRSNLQTEKLLTAVLVASALGLVVFWSVSLLGSWVTRSWNPSVLAVRAH